MFLTGVVKLFSSMPADAGFQDYNRLGHYNVHSMITAPYEVISRCWQWTGYSGMPALRGVTFQHLGEAPCALPAAAFSQGEGRGAPAALLSLAPYRGSAGSCTAGRAPASGSCRQPGIPRDYPTANYGGIPATHQIQAGEFTASQTEDG